MRVPNSNQCDRDALVALVCRNSNLNGSSEHFGRCKSFQDKSWNPKETKGDVDTAEKLLNLVNNFNIEGYHKYVF
jgi:hypothetical protein